MGGHAVGFRTWCRAALLVLAELVLACGSHDGGPPSVAELHVVVTTAGLDIDADGYSYSVDNGPSHAIAAAGSVLLSQLPPGAHQIAFAGIAGNCQPVSSNPVVVTLSPGESRDITFEVTCAPRLRLVPVTTGVDADIAYLAALDGGPWRLLLTNVQVNMAGVPGGSHELRIAGVAPNCTLSGNAQRTIIVPGDDTTTIHFDVACTATTRRILFGSTRDGGYDLYVMDADGTNTIRLTDSTMTALHGRWSPDGAKIAYYSPAGATGSDIFVMNANGSGSTPLTLDGAAGAVNEFPDWSPDGTKILFEKGSGIWVMGADGTNAHQLLGFGKRPRWSPDGNLVAFHSGSAVWVVDADGSSARIIQDIGTFYSAYPVWSPNGTKILFASPRDGAFTDIYVMYADGSGVVRLTHSPGGVLNEDFDWSPDGTKIAFRTNRDSGNPEIYVMNADGSNPTRIAPNVWDEYGPAWHP